MTTPFSASRPEEACTSAPDSASAWGSGPVSPARHGAAAGPALASPWAAGGAADPRTNRPRAAGHAEVVHRTRRPHPPHPAPGEPPSAAPRPAGPSGAQDGVDAGPPSRTADLWAEEDGLATAEYGIVMLAAVGFAGLLVAVLSSGEVQEMLHGIVERALSL